MKQRRKIRKSRVILIISLLCQVIAHHHNHVSMTNRLRRAHLFITFK